MKYVGNAFSLQMIKDDGCFRVTTISKKQFMRMKDDCESIMGHPEMCTLYNLQYNRASIKMEKGDILLVAQVTSGRLPPNCHKLPDNVKMGYRMVEVL